MLSVTGTTIPTYECLCMRDLSNTFKRPIIQLNLNGSSAGTLRANTEDIKGGHAIINLMIHVACRRTVQSRVAVSGPGASMTQRRETTTLLKITA